MTRPGPLRPTGTRTRSSAASALTTARACGLGLDALTGNVCAFATMMRELSGHNLRAWCFSVHTDDVPALRSLADGFLRDEEAVAAGLTLPWNSGPVESNVTRIKFLKRQCFGRAQFDLLRKRILLTR